MRFKTFIVAMLAQAFSLSYAADQQSCSSYVGQSIKPLSFNQASAPFTKMSPKGEFEATAQYEARLNSTLQALPSPMVISKEIREGDFLKYDADQSALIVLKFVFDNTNFDVRPVFYHSKVEDFSPKAGSHNLALVVAQTDKPAGSYIASNAFGKTLRVTKIQRSVSIIFDQPRRSFMDSLFLGKKSGEIGSIPMSPEAAKAFKANYKVALVVQPKKPYIAKAKFLEFEPTIEVPEEVRTEATVLIADIFCGLVMNGKGDVVAAYETSTANKSTPENMPSQTISNFPSGAYISRITARILPNIVFADEIIGNPTAAVEVRTAPEGTIISRKLVKSSGDKSWDDAVLKAIDKTEILPRDVDGRIPNSLVLSFRPKD